MPSNRCTCHEHIWARPGARAQYVMGRHIISGTIQDHPQSTAGGCFVDLLLDGDDRASFVGLWRLVPGMVRQ